ncbi:Fcf1-domain-containing protein [Lophiotrema nucula]|uniref:U three protein 23 n=1 Tax=Lophiotrema nucula TaxID=690887 RepID=A0A6A5ZHV7_9PLEO|nr:Fcf1-domain-containing protein [Lophiotrema nucula]
MGRQKQSKKLMQQYKLHHNLREPYQVLLGHEILQEAAKSKIDLIGRLQKLMQGQVKPMITQCDMRHLYNAKPKDNALIDLAKTYERRRCGHHELEEPLTSLECLSACVDPNDTLNNKFGYCVASNDAKVRAHLRKIPGVPLIYISRSVVILEPMTEASIDHREREEKAKFKAGLKGRRTAANAGQKRKRDDEDEETGQAPQESIEGRSTGDARPQKKKSKGPKGPNPLSVKKSKKDAPVETSVSKPKSASIPQTLAIAETSIADDGESGKGKRKRKHKPKGGGHAEPHLVEDEAVS